MVGGGQLARMTLQAAIDLDIEMTVLAPDTEAPAIRAAGRHLIGDPSSARDLHRLATRSDVITFDHERIPPHALRSLEAAGHLLRPAASAKLFAQDKIRCSKALEAAGVPIPRWAAADGPDAVAGFGERWGWPVVLKRSQGAYDGRGVWIVDDVGAAASIFDLLGPGEQLLVEERVAFERELAVLVARSPTGKTVVYPVLETRQRDGICREVIAPAACSPEMARTASALGARIAELTGATGIICVELFETSSGLLVNELAMRPHNSGHLTLDAFETSQFENHLRGVLGLPLGSARRTAPAAAMVNVLGAPDGSDPALRLGEALRVPQARVRLYGKRARPGRKLGHVTALGDTVEQALGRAREAAFALSDA